VCIAIALCSVPGIYLYTQLIDLVYQGMTLLVAGLLAMLVVFLLGTMQHLLAIISQRKWWIQPSALLIIFTACIVVGLLKKEPSVEFPKPDSIVYACNNDSNSARWMTFDERTDAWTQQFFALGVDSMGMSTFFPAVSAPFLTSNAPTVASPDPVVTVESDRCTDTVRTLKLSITSEKEVIELSMIADSGAVVYDARVNDKPFADIEQYIPQITRFVQRQTRPWTLDYFGQTCELELKIPAKYPFHLRVIQRFSGIPQEAMKGMTPRPDWTIPRPFYPTDVSVVAKTFSF
jgi:hypothetical protein